MKLISKYRIVNKYRVTLFLFFLTGFFLSLCSSYNFYLLRIIFDNDGSANKIFLLEHYLNFDSYISTSFNYSMLILPIFCSILSLSFYQEKEGYFIYCFFRNKDYIKTIRKALFINAFYTALTFLIAYLIFFIVGVFTSKNYTEIPRISFDFIFGNNFSTKHIHMYYFIEGILKYFLFCFIYSLFSNSVVCITKKKYLPIIIPLLYYYIFSIIFGICFKVFALSPTIIQSFTSYQNGQPLWVILFPFILPIIFVAYIQEYLKKRGDLDGY